MFMCVFTLCNCFSREDVSNVQHVTQHTIWEGLHILYLYISVGLTHHCATCAECGMQGLLTFVIPLQCNWVNLTFYLSLSCGGDKVLKGITPIQFDKTSTDIILT